MKFGLSSSRCETDPAKAEPGRSVASLGPVATTALAMCRQASVWAGAYSPETLISRVSKLSSGPKTEPRRRKRVSRRGPGRGVRIRHAGRGRPSNLGGPVVLRKNQAVGRRQGEPEPRPKDSRESEGRIRAMTVGNGWHPDPPEQRRAVCKPAREEGCGPAGSRAGCPCWYEP
jgi:hypothetical protein